MVWTLSDLIGNLETAAVFLFGSAFQDLWKTTVGTVIAILNPDIMDNTKNSKDKATLKIVSADRVLILGQSKDYGICKHKKNNGDPCSSFVNVSSSDFCIYHLRQAYQNCCKRSEFQSGSKGLTALRNKVLGKNEVFYAGKSYTAIPAKKNTKQVVKDNFRLQALNENITISANPLIKNKKPIAIGRAVSFDTSANQRQNDLLQLQKLGWTPNTVKPDSVSSKQKDTETLQKLGVDSESATDEGVATKQPEYIDLNVDFKKMKKTTLNAAALTLLTGNKIVLGTDPPKPCPSRFDKAKQQAISYIKKNGPLSKEDPNYRKNTGNKKRSLDVQDVQGLSKKLKISLDNPENSFASERFKKMMALTSNHKDLLEQHDDEEQEKYFSKLEMKERLEEKMLNTFKVPCKAVKCLKCKYTSFSATDRCKDEKHPLRVFDSFKRFFKCGKCSNRTVSLEIVPMFSCKKCGSGKWEKTSMMKEKRTEIVAEKLSIRGDEEKFINSNTSDANLNLMVPDESV
ncbi:protein MCM10 homolog isoform X3 [Agrilus planipennis]|nr:protein MCM10 homolog isoform X3 [Agrilus planipennis]